MCDVYDNSEEIQKWRREVMIHHVRRCKVHLNQDLSLKGDLIDELAIRKYRKAELNLRDSYYRIYDSLLEPGPTFFISFIEQRQNFATLSAEIKSVARSHLSKDNSGNIIAHRSRVNMAFTIFTDDRLQRFSCWWA